MTSVTFQVPDAFMTIPAPERNQLFLTGLYEALRSRARQLEAEILQAQSRVKHFENTYSASFQDFEVNVLPTLNSWEAHDDYNDWFFWQTLLDKKSNLLQVMIAKKNLQINQFKML